MQRKTYILFLMLFAIFAGVVSCNKKHPIETPFTRIQGKWKKVQYATDDNNDGVIQASEIHPQPNNIVDEINFTNEETGTETTVSNGTPAIPLTFNWKIVGGDSVWVAYRANDTVTYYIALVSSHNLQLTTPTLQGLASYYYSK